MDRIVDNLNPISLEAVIFAETLNNLADTHNYIDDNLANILNYLIDSIEHFLNKSKRTTIDNKENNISPKDLKDIKHIYHCAFCKIDLGKSVVNATQHLTNKCRKFFRSNQSALFNEDIEKFLTTNVGNYLTEAIKVSDKLKYIPEYHKIEHDIIALIKPIFSNQAMRVYLVGSRFTGIGSHNSDVDIFLDIGNSFNIFENRPSAITEGKIVNLYKALNAAPNIWKRVVKITTARVPIVKALHKSTNIECDINVSNGLSVINTLLLGHIFDQQPIIRRMCIILKFWLLRTNLRNILSSYALALMVIFYMQTLDLIPSIEFYQKEVDLSKAVIIGPWLGSFVTKNVKLRTIKSSITNCQKYLKKFFDYYANFNYQTYIVSTYKGKLIKINELEQEMPNRYHNYIRTNNANNDLKLESKKPIVVQDPIQLNHNVTKAITDIELSTIIEIMTKSAKVIPNY